MKLTDSELVALCESEIDNASGTLGGDLAAQREDALARYLGEPYGDEVEGRSQVRTREVMQTVEWIKPSLMRLFVDADNLCVFEPRGPEDEEQAAQETDTVNYAFWTQNNGFLNLLTFITDALLSKTGVIKYWWDDAEEEEREEYKGLDEMQLGQLMADPTVEREVLEATQDETGGWAVAFKTVKRTGRLRIEPVAPEHFGVSRNARSPYPADAGFVFHRAQMSYADMIDAGYSPALVRSLPTADEVETGEEIARRNLSDEQSYGFGESPSTRVYWVTECYLRADRNGDDVPELLKVTLAGGRYSSSGYRLLDIEEVDHVPFVAASPVLLTHKFYGLSIADLMADLQQIKTTLTRQILDNAYLANNGRTAINDEQVNVDDALVYRPGGVVRYRGPGPASQYIMPLPHSPLPPETFGILEYLDNELKQRTGVGDETAALDKTALANVNTGVMAMAYDAARSKIELVARTLAEIGLKPLFMGIHELLQKHQDKPMAVRLRNQWVQVNPSEWRTRENVTVNVGMGQASRERRILMMDAINQRQVAMMQVPGGASMITPLHLYRSTADWMKAWGAEPDLYLIDPRQNPPPPQGPSIEQQAVMVQAQAMLMDAQAKQQANEVAMYKAQVEAQAKGAEVQARMAEAAARAELDSLKARQTAIKSELDTAGKVSDMRMEMERRDNEARMNALQMYLDHMKAEKDRERDYYKIQMDAMTKSLQAHGVTQGSPEEQAAKQERETMEAADKEQGKALMAAVYQNLLTVSEKLAAMEAAKSQPVTVERDARGLMISVGGRPVKRDEAGRVLQIG